MQRRWVSRFAIRSDLRSSGGDHAHRSCTFPHVGFGVTPKKPQGPSQYLGVIDAMDGHRLIARITSDKIDFIGWHESVFRRCAAKRSLAEIRTVIEKSSNLMRELGREQVRGRGLVI